MKRELFSELESLNEYGLIKELPMFSSGTHHNLAHYDLDRFILAVKSRQSLWQNNLATSDEQVDIVEQQWREVAEIFQISG